MSAAERSTYGVTYGATNKRQFCSWRPNAQPMAQPTAQPIGGRFIRGGRARNLWHNKWEDVPFSAGERAAIGATNKRAFGSWGLSAQSMVPPADWRFVLGVQARNLWRSQQQDKGTGGGMTLTMATTTTTMAMTRPKPTTTRPMGPRNSASTAISMGLRSIFARRLGWLLGPSWEQSCDLSQRPCLAPSSQLPRLWCKWALV